jgi:hypothetical protein
MRWTSRRILGGLPSNTFMGMSIGRGHAVDQLELLVVGGHAHHRQRGSARARNLRKRGQQLSGATAIT